MAALNFAIKITLIKKETKKHYLIFGWCRSKSRQNKLVTGVVFITSITGFPGRCRETTIEEDNSKFKFSFSLALIAA